MALVSLWKNGNEVRVIPSDVKDFKKEGWSAKKSAPVQASPPPPPPPKAPASPPHAKKGPAIAPSKK